MDRRYCHAGGAEYMAYPRACALAEVAWSPLDNKDYENFYGRLANHLNRLKEMNVNFRPLDPLEIVEKSTSDRTHPGAVGQ